MDKAASVPLDTVLGTQVLSTAAGIVCDVPHHTAEYT